MSKEFKLDKAEVADDFDPESASELIKVRDTLSSMVDELNIKIAKIGIKEALKEAKFSNKPIEARGMKIKSIRVDKEGNVTTKS